MTNKMSAAGKLGRHKYDNPEQQDFTQRTYFLAEDIRPQHDKDRDMTIEKVKHLQIVAINKQGGKLRQVLSKGLYKYKVEDFKMPCDFREEFCLAKKDERLNRKTNFNTEMDNIII